MLKNLTGNNSIIILALYVYMHWEELDTPLGTIVKPITWKFLKTMTEVALMCSHLSTPL